MYKITQGADVSKGIKTVIYGVEGIGKTTLASKFPDPLFIDTEGSTTHFANIKRLEKPADWKDLQEMVQWVALEKPCKTLVIDTFDWAEMAEVEDLLKANGWRSIEAPGYGKGFTQSMERIAEFLKLLEAELIDKGINVVLNCHAQIRKIELPEEQGSFDKYELKLGNKTSSKTSPLVKEWADMVLFCNYMTIVERGSDGKAKARGGQKRVIHTTHSAVWDAKNRFGLPDERPMEWESIAPVFAGREKQNCPDEAKKDADRSEKPEPKPEKAQPKPKKETKAKSKKAEHVQDPAELEPAGKALTFPEGVPAKVVNFCQERQIYADDVQEMLYAEKIVKNQNFDLAKVPQKFWNSFVVDFEDKWAVKIAAAKDANLPF